MPPEVNLPPVGLSTVTDIFLTTVDLEVPDKADLLCGLVVAVLTQELSYPAYLLRLLTIFQHFFWPSRKFYPQHFPHQLGVQPVTWDLLHPSDGLALD